MKGSHLLIGGVALVFLVISLSAVSSDETAGGGSWVVWNIWWVIIAVTGTTVAVVLANEFLLPLVRILSETTKAKVIIPILVALVIIFAIVLYPAIYGFMSIVQ